MKSLRQLTDQLIGVNLVATNISMWQQEATLREYARVAINDAILAFPTRIEMVYTSGVAADGVVVLPKDVDNVIRIEVCATTGIDRYEAKHWALVPTPNTTYVRIHDDVSGRLDITYRYLQPELPTDVGMVDDSTTLLNVSATTGPSYLWPSQGYIECSKPGGGEREVLHYGATWYSGAATDEGGFGALQRNIEGFVDPNEEWAASTHVSACYVCKAADMRPVMLQAQANMYAYFIRHRAMYEQYTAIASQQALGLDDLQVLIRELEGRARRARRSQRRLPPPSGTKRRRPIPH